MCKDFGQGVCMCEREQEDWKCFLAPGCHVLKARTKPEIWPQESGCSTTCRWELPESL